MRVEVNEMRMLRWACAHSGVMKKDTSRNDQQIRHRWQIRSQPKRLKWYECVERRDEGLYMKETETKTEIQAERLMK